jgi:hypothetical protein
MYPLEPDAAEMHRLVDEAMRRIIAHVGSLHEQRGPDTWRTFREVACFIRLSPI